MTSHHDKAIQLLTLADHKIDEALNQLTARQTRCEATLADLCALIAAQQTQAQLHTLLDLAEAIRDIRTLGIRVV